MQMRALLFPGGQWVAILLHIGACLLAQAGANRADIELPYSLGIDRTSKFMDSNQRSMSAWEGEITRTDEETGGWSGSERT
jgi:hypothetical protein